MKLVGISQVVAHQSRSPCGERGLKCRRKSRRQKRILSLPVRGAWIEIQRIRPFERGNTSLPVRGAWIEIQSATMGNNQHGSRSPCGERGLKSLVLSLSTQSVKSLPVRGAWIEIRNTVNPNEHVKCRSPCGERGLKSTHPQITRGKWRRSPCGERGLKLSDVQNIVGSITVAPRAGSVD